MREEDKIQMLGYFNIKIIVNTTQICHLKNFPQFLLYGCNVALIVPYHQKIIYIHHKIYNYLANFLDKQSCIIKITMFEI